MKSSLAVLVASLVVNASAAAAQAAHPPDAIAYTKLAESDLLDFRYSFPTVVGTYPALLAKIRKDESAQYDQALQTARADVEARMEIPDAEFHRHEFWRDWTVAGDARPLLSVQSRVDDFTGGAHGNHRSSALLWDQDRDAQVDMDVLFGGPEKLWQVIQGNYCSKLQAERVRRKTDSVGCPERKELTIVPVDSDFDFQFDTLRVIADPYVAGSYAEGFYVIALPVTQSLLNLVDPHYRPAFEAQRPQ